MAESPNAAHAANAPFDRHRIGRYLAFGFLPEVDEHEPLSLLRAWSRAPRRAGHDVTEAGLVREGVAALRATFEDCAARSAVSGDQVVFLSGGLDSRTILGALLDMFERSEITAATFGLPGELDYDFAAQVAAFAGVRHERLETFSVDWLTQGLVDSVLARRIPVPLPFGQRYLSSRLHERIGSEGNVFWEGLFGGAVSGCWAPSEDERPSWEVAVDEFVTRHLRLGWERLVFLGFDPAASMPPAPFCSDDTLSFPDQLNFAIRQVHYIGTRRLNGYAINTP